MLSEIGNGGTVARGLRVRRLSVWYQGVIRAVESIDLDVPPGTTCGIVGLNGAGKTTMLRALSGFLKSEHVKVFAQEMRLDGDNLAGLSPVRCSNLGVAIVAERDKVFASLSINENLQLAVRRIKETAGRQAMLAEVFERFPILKSRSDQKAGLLSGGERQMLALAVAFLARPRLLLLDEPSLGLSPGMVLEVERVIRQIVSERQITCIIADQNAALVSGVCDQMHLLRRGCLEPQNQAGLNKDTMVEALLGGGKGSLS